MERNTKNIKIKFTIISVIILVIVIIIAKYITDSGFRAFVDSKIFNKQLSENNLPIIELKSDDNPISFAYDNHIGVFAKNTLSIYDEKGKMENELSINITTPLINTNEKYLIISEKGGNKFYVINSTSILWQGSVDGKIEKVNINSNGYVSIIVTNSTHTSIVIAFNADGNELFKTFLHSTYAMCAAISNNNNYLAIGEVDYSGTVIKSNIRIMSIADAKTIYTYKSSNNSIITNINYSNKDIATCMFSDSIVNVSTNSNEKIYDLNEKMSFSNIDMKQHVSVIESQSSGLFSYEYQLKFISTSNKSERLYVLNKLPKQTVATGDFIALNYGNSVDIVNKSGNLKKNYTSSKQIKDIIIGEHIAGIIYKDKLEIINL